MNPQLHDTPRITIIQGSWRDIPSMPDIGIHLLGFNAPKVQELNPNGLKCPNKSHLSHENIELRDQVLKVLKVKPLTSRQIWQKCKFKEGLTPEQQFIKIRNLIKRMGDLLENNHNSNKTVWWVR